jgi:mannose-6-phosphate isomerase-like protein (cupin superfamily)
MALFQGEYQWHKHTNEEELFYVYKGKVTIRMRAHEDIKLSEGEMVVVPKNMEHRPESSEPSYVIMFEPYKLKSKGD